MGTIVSSVKAPRWCTATGSGAEFGKIAAGLGTTRRDRFPGRPAQVLVSASLRGDHADGPHPGHQSAAAGPSSNRCSSRWPSPSASPAAAARSRQQQSGGGSRQLARRRSLVKRLVCIEGPGRHRCPDHRQDRHSHRGAHPASSTPWTRLEQKHRRTSCGWDLATDVDPAASGASGNDMDTALWNRIRMPEADRRG